MAYQLYLYKEFSTKSGTDIRLEIFERDYSGSQIEIDNLASSPVSLITDNASNDLTNNIIKSSVIINLVDTEQVDYTRLFTSDATKFKVVVKINGVTEWTGYLTPDSFYQPLTYRNIIQLTARDNLGMLSEFVYQEDGLASISSVISAVLDKISFGCTLEYRVKKVDGNGTNIVNGMVNRTLFFGKNYEEVLSIILGGIGCQMRFVGGNKYAVFDVADLDSYGEAGDAQDFFFVNQSGNLELVPAWKDLQVRQDYATTQEILTQRPKQSDLVFAGTKSMPTDYEVSGSPAPISVNVNTYTPFGNNWVGTLPILSPYEWGYDKNTILITGLERNYETFLSYPPMIEFFKDVPAYYNGIKITFSAHNLLMMPDYDLYLAGKNRLTDRSPLTATKVPNYITVLLYNVFLVSGGVTYRLGETWEVAGTTPDVNKFYIDKPYKDEMQQYSGSDVPCEINILSTLGGGQLQFHMYGYFTYGATGSLLHKDLVAKISDFKIQIISDEPGGRESLVVNNDNFNIKGGISLSLGQVPTGKLNSLSMLGGIYQNTPPYYPPMGGFKRTGGVEMHLSEQIGREYLNLRKQQRISLSGTIMTTGLPDFGKSFTYKGKNYSLNYGSLDYESEQMQVELIEAESYTYEDYTFIDAEVDTGSGSLGSGATEFIQWSSAGNAKRIYELDTASEADQGGAFVFIDKSGLTAAKKVPISSLSVDAYTKTESDSRFASIDGDLTQDFSAKKLTTATLLLPQSAPALASGETAIYSLDSGFSGETPSGAGTLTSISMAVPTGLSVTPETITESGTFTIGYASGYSIPTNTKQSEWDSAYDHSQITSGNPHGTTAADVEALALSGGTITGGFGALSIKRGGAFASGVKFENNIGILGYIGIDTTFTPIFVSAESGTTYTLYHSGNSNLASVNWSAAKLTSTTLILPQSAPTLATGEMGLYALDSGFSGETPSGAGSVTSIGLTMPTGFAVSGSPITESGTFGVTFASGYFLPTTTQFASKLDVSLKGSANGLAELDENGFVKNTQLPSYVDDVIEVDNFASLPATGETGKIYVTKDDNKTWRWGGSIYVQMYAGIALGETSSTAYRGDRGKIAYDHSQSTGNPHGTTFAQLLSKPTTISGYGIGMEDVSWNSALTNNTIGFLSGGTDSPVSERTHFGIGMHLVGNPAYSGVFVVRNNRAFFQTKENGTLQGWNEFYHSGNSNLASVNWLAKNLTLAGSITGATSISASGVANVGGFRVSGSSVVGNGVGLEIYYTSSNKRVSIQNYHRGVDNEYYIINFAASEYLFDVGDVKIRTTTQSTAYNKGALVISGGLGIAKDLFSNGKGSFNTLIIPQAAPTLAGGEMAIYGLESGFSGETPSGAGSVESVALVSNLTGISVTGSPITTSGTFTLNFVTGYSIPTNIKQGEWDNAYTNRIASLTTTGSGAATLIGNVLNIPTYTLPTATGSVLGGVKIGSNITITNGVISVTSPHNAVTLGTANGLSLSTQVLSLGLASASTNGALSSTDWNTFNGKQAKLTGTGASSLVRVNTLGVIDYDDSTYLTGNQTITLSGIITGSGTTAITTAIADNALSIAKTNGLQSALDAKMTTTSYPDLVAIEALTGTSGFLKKTAANTWALDTNSYALISGATTQDFQAKNLTLAGSIIGATTITATSTIQATTAKLTNLTDGYIPYHISDGSGLGNSVISQSGTTISIGGALAISSVANVGGFRVSGSSVVGNGVGLEIYYTSSNKRVSIQNYHRGVDNEYYIINFAASEYLFDIGDVKIRTTTQSTAYTNGGLVLSGGLGIAKDLFSNGKAVFASSVQMSENINTNLRIPKVAPTSPTSGEYYFYIVE